VVVLDGMSERKEVEKEEIKDERKRERYACVRELLGATNERVRRGNRSVRPQRQQTPANWADIF